jgi:biopolymer transport protein ExbD
MRLTSHKPQRESQPELPMTSMIDVVFLLLIFFMTTSAFVKTERELDSGIKVNRAAGSALEDFDPAVIDVVAADTGYVFRIGSRDISTQQELTRVLRQFPNRDAAFVRVSDEVPFDLAAAAIQACKSARFVTVSYVPLQPEP